MRLVVECKDRAVSGRAMRDELVEAKRNRDAAVGLVVFSAAHAPAGIAPFDVRMGDVYCAIDPGDPEPATLDAALRLARLLALASTREADAEVDAAAVHEALERVRAELDAVRGLKTKLTTIGTAAKAVNAGLDQLRDGIVARIAEAEAELRHRAPDREPSGWRSAATGRQGVTEVMAARSSSLPMTPVNLACSRPSRSMTKTQGGSVMPQASA